MLNNLLKFCEMWGTEPAPMPRSEALMPNPKYEVILFWREEDKTFIAEVPELPGCAADGKTYKESLANVEVIIHEWIDTARELGRPIPKPRGRLVFA